MWLPKAPLHCAYRTQPEGMTHYRHQLQLHIRKETHTACTRNLVTTRLTAQSPAQDSTCTIPCKPSVYIGEANKVKISLVDFSFGNLDITSNWLNFFWSWSNFWWCRERSSSPRPHNTALELQVRDTGFPSGFIYLFCDLGKLLMYSKPQLGEVKRVK